MKEYIQFRKKIEMHHVQRQILNKIRYLSNNDLHNCTTNYVMRKRVAGGAFVSPQTQRPEEVDQCLVPSFSENDNGSLAFKDSTWRKNKNWAIQFSSTTFLPQTNTKRGLFGNVLLDGSTVRQKNLNSLLYKTGARQTFMIQQMCNIRDK
jgi:hypothetical protein